MSCGFLSSLLWPAAGRLLSPPSGTCRRSDTQTPSWMWSLREWERCSAWPETQETNRQRRNPNRWWTAPNRRHWRTAAWSGTTYALPEFVLCFSSCFLLAVSGWWRLFGSEHQSHTTTQTDLLVLAALDQQPCVLQAKMTVFVYGVWWLWRHQHVWKLTSSLHSLLPVNPTCPTRPLCWRPLSSSRALRQSSATRTKRRTAKDGTRPSWTWLQ